MHTNALAVATGIAAPELHAEILQRVLQDRSVPKVQPYFMHFVFQALHQAGLFSSVALGEMRRWKVLLDEHPGSLKEGWDFGDYSHAWSATPAYQLSAHVLGVLPLAPGFSQVSIRPMLGDLQWASGAVPTPGGLIELSWNKEAGRLSGLLKGPAGCRIHLRLDGVDCADIRVSALPGREPVSRLSQDGGAVTWVLGDGTYQVEH